MRILGWVEVQTRALAVRLLPSARRDPLVRSRAAVSQRATSGLEAFFARAGGAADALSTAVWFRRAAEAGHRGAMAELAEALRTGHGVRRDPEEAARWGRPLQG